MTFVDLWKFCENSEFDLWKSLLIFRHKTHTGGPEIAFNSAKLVKGDIRPDYCIKALNEKLVPKIAQSILQLQNF